MSEKPAKKRVCVVLTRPYLEGLDRLVGEEVYSSYAQLIRDALRRLFIHYGIEMVGAE